MPTLSEVYEHPAVRELGEALGKALGDEETRDYASLIDIEFTQSPVDFADALHRFLRRFLTFAEQKRQKGEIWYCPSDQRVWELMQLVDKCAEEMHFKDQQRKVQEAIRLVRAALLGRAIPQACYLRRQQYQRQVQTSIGGES